MNRRHFLRETLLGAAALTLPDKSIAPSGMEKSHEPLPDPVELPLAGEWFVFLTTATTGEPTNWKIAPPTRADGWKAVILPRCWERDLPADFTGTMFYRRDVALPEPWRSGIRLWWEHDAVSYHAEGWAGGQSVGEHAGLWDRFTWEVPRSALAPNGTLTLALAVEKPGSRAYPVRETLTGYLPTPGGTWGGVWQESRLRATGAAALHDLWAHGSGDGNVQVRVTLDAPAGTRTILQFIVRDGGGKIVARKQSSEPESRNITATLTVPKAELWEPARPVLYKLTVTALIGGAVSDVRTRQIGFRDFTTLGKNLLLNGKPLLLRAALAWGWYPDERAPNPPLAAFEAEMRRIRALGFNAVQLAYWIPPQHYFEIADALGILLWVALPIYNPKDTEFFRKQIPGELTRIVRQIGDHPSVCLWTVDGEPSRTLDSGFLESLVAVVRKQGTGLLCPYTGSAEETDAAADFAQVPSFPDLPFARSAFETRALRWHDPIPFLWETADADGFRDLPAITAKNGGKLPWWTKEPLPQNLVSRTVELAESSRKQALFTRKTLIETVRGYPFTSGYTIVGLTDTPLSTSGFFDDLNRSRFTPDEFALFNSDTVLLIEPERQMASIAGGDRPDYSDRYGVLSGNRVRRRVGVSHFGAENEGASLRWQVRDGAGKAIVRGEIPIKRLTPGTITDGGWLQFDPPKVQKPTRLTVALDLTFESGRIVANAWQMWVYPSPQRDDRRQIALFDPGDHLPGFSDAVGLIPTSNTDTDPTRAAERRAPLTVATTWRPTMLNYVRGGGKLILIQDAPGDGFPAVRLPFWRGAMRLFEPHPLWGDFPHERTTGTSFYGLATDLAFDLEAARLFFGDDVGITSLLTRVDTRTFAQHSYLMVAQVGRGTILLTTLRPQGGRGDQPSGVRNHIGGANLLRTWIDGLEGLGEP